MDASSDPVTPETLAFFREHRRQTRIDPTLASCSKYARIWVGPATAPERSFWTRSRRNP